MEYVTLTFAKRSKSLDPLFGFPVPVRRWLDLERSYLAGWRMWGSRRAVFAFWPTFTYLCDCDIHLNDRSKIPISKTVLTTVKPPRKLVHNEVLLASSPQWPWSCESPSKWLDLIFGYLFWHALEFTQSVHIWQICRFDRIVAHIVIRMTLTYFCAYDTRVKSFRAHISETITTSTVCCCRRLDCHLLAAEPFRSLHLVAYTVQSANYYYICSVITLFPAPPEDLSFQRSFPDIIALATIKIQISLH